MTLRVESAGKTDVGLVREKNEDAMLLAPEIGLWAVCDGMGGHVGGQVASQLSVATIDEVIRTGKPAPQDDEPDPLVAAIRCANGTVFARARAAPRPPWSPCCAVTARRASGRPTRT
jgi:serine/threonine protein phosphatase PrpC